MEYETMRDIDVCLAYQETGDSEAWAHIVKKYNNVLRKFARQMYTQTLSVSKGMEVDDCYIEACVQTQKAMLYVNPAKINLPYDKQDKAVYRYIESYCLSWIKNQWNSADTKKSGFTRDAKGQIMSPEQEENAVTVNLTVAHDVQNDVEDSFVSTFARSLQGVEQKVYAMLNDGYSAREIRSELKINPKGYKAIFEGIHCKFLALKEDFADKKLIISL